MFETMSATELVERFMKIRKYPIMGSAGRGPKMEAGLILAIEPMVTAGDAAVETLEDGWTVVTRDRKWASHYEDTVAFTEDGYMNLTRDPSEKDV